MRIMKQMACAALAAACVIGFPGCGKDKDKSSSSSDSSKGYSAPKVAEGAIAAIAVRRVEDTSLASLCKQYGLEMGELLKNAPGGSKSEQDLIKELELDKAKIEWIAVTVDAVSAEKAEKGEPDFGVAIASSLDLDKVVAVVEKKNKGKNEIKKETIANVPAYVVIKDEKPEAFLANLDKQLILVARTSAGLEKLVALYRDGKGASADFGSFALGANDILHVKAVKVGENLKTAGVLPMAGAMVGQSIPDGDKIVAGLGTAEIALGASDDGKDIKLNVSVETATDADAENIRKTVKEMLEPFAEMMKTGAEKDPDAKLLSDILASVKVAGEGKTAALSASVAADPALKALGDKAKELK